MDADLRAFLAELYQFGRENDAAEMAHAKRMLNITPETGEFLRMLVIAANLQRVLELGTSNGYSTLWLADGCCQTGGRVITVEKNQTKYAQALQNFGRAGLQDAIETRLADAGPLLPKLRGFDLVFLDADRSQYVGWWPKLQLVLRIGGLLVVDNATSHPDELADFARGVEAADDFTSVLVPIGNGELLILKES